MKKDYQKPLLFAEQFALSEHISKGCVYQTTFNGNDCPVTVDGLTYFTTTDVCDPDAVSILSFVDGFSADMKNPVEFLIEKVNPTCYNSLADFHQMFVS